LTRRAAGREKAPRSSSGGFFNKETIKKE